MWHIEDPLLFLPDAVDGLYTKLDVLFRFRTTGMVDLFCMQPYLHGKKQRPLVFKMLRPHLLTNAMALKLLQNDAEKSILIDHPRFMKIRGVMQTYLIYDWIEGAPLHERPQVNTTNLARDLLEVISVLEEKGLVHSNLTPEAIFSGRDEHFYVSDLSLCFSIHNEHPFLGIARNQEFVEISLFDVRERWMEIDAHSIKSIYAHYSQ